MHASHAHAFALIMTHTSFRTDVGSGFMYRSRELYDTALALPTLNFVPPSFVGSTVCAFGQAKLREGGTHVRLELFEQVLLVRSQYR